MEQLSADSVTLQLYTGWKTYKGKLSQELASRSNGLYTLQESSMYPTLYRLVEKGMITDRQEKVRVYYHLEETGLEYLAALRKEYCAICRGVLSILGITEIKDLEKG